MMKTQKTILPRVPYDVLETITTQPGGMTFYEAMREMQYLTRDEIQRAFATLLDAGLIRRDGKTFTTSLDLHDLTQSFGVSNADGVR
jgi:DNA-binding IclR family transcriptional regulator